MKRTNPSKLVFALLFAIMAGITGCSKNSEKTNTTNPANAPAITSITPLKALPGSEISVYGKNFNATLNLNTVTINGITAKIDSASATEIVFTLPANATSGKIQLVSNGTTAASGETFTVTSPTTVSTFATAYLEHIGFDAAGNAYGDNGTDTVFKITAAGVKSTLAVIPGPVVAGAATHEQLWGTAVDAAGNVYESASTYFKIFKITPSGVVSTFAGTGTAGHADGPASSAQFVYPLGLAIDAKGNLYANDSHYIRKITPAGVVSTIAGTGLDGHADGAANVATFGNIEGITIDAKGNIFVSDNKYDNIREISNTGIVTTLAGNGTAGIQDGQGLSAEFAYPQAMAVDAGGNIFVADNNFVTSNWVYSVREIKPDGTVSTFLNGANFSAVITGAYNVATTSFPDGITFDASGNMYICNTAYLTGYLPETISKITFQ